MQQATGQGEVLLSAPYPEGAVVEMSKGLGARGLHPVLALPSRSLSLALVKFFPRGRAHELAERLTRGLVPGSDTVTVGRMLEVIRLVARLPLIRTFFPGTIDVMKAQFDRALAGSGRGAKADVIIGMPAACAVTFERHPGALKVFHAVDGHPAAVNDYLQRAYGARARRELVPRRRARRISRELRLADLVLVPSRLVARQMIAAGVRQDKISVVPYGVDARKFRPEVGTEHRSARPLVLFVGQLSRRKGIPTLAAATARVDVDLLLVGPIVDRRLLRELPRNARHRSAVPPSELRDLFNSADAFVLPSIEDSFGLVVTEALLCGLPIISTDATGAVEVLDADDGSVVPAGDVDALAAALTAVAHLDPSEREARSSRTRDRINSGELLDWVGYNDRVAALIHTALENSRP